MAFTQYAVGRVRVSGNDANGAFYDSSISGAGTDYSQQDSPQLSLTDLVSTASTTITSLTGGFTSAMIGNALRISAGVGATTGYYFITAVTDTNTITVDRASGTYIAGTGRVGGAAATIFRLLNSANSVGDKVVAGNAVYVRGAGSDTPSTDDYTMTGDILPQLGTNTVTGGPVKLIGENGRPRLKSDGRMFQPANYMWFENLYLTASGNTNGTNGILQVGVESTIRNVYVNTANRDTLAGIRVNNLSTVDDCHVFATTGTPTANANCEGILAPGYGCLISNCILYGLRDDAILASNGIIAIGNIIYKNAGIGINIVSGGTGFTLIERNTIDSGQDHGIQIQAASALITASIRNNIISNHTGGGKNGLNISDGTSALAINNFFKRHVDYNWYFNNTANFGTISAGSNDNQGTTPDFTAAATLDFSTGQALDGEGWPGTIRGTTTTTSTRPGVWQEGGVTLTAPFDLNRVLRKVIELEKRIHLMQLRLLEESSR